MVCMVLVRVVTPAWKAAVVRVVPLRPSLASLASWTWEAQALSFWFSTGTTDVMGLTQTKHLPPAVLVLATCYHLHKGSAAADMVASAEARSSQRKVLKNPMRV